MTTPPTRNIFIELELSLDPPIIEVGAMKEHLEKEKIPYWNNNKGSQQKFERFLARAKSYIADGLPQLEEQGKKARAEKYDELTSQAKIINEVGVTEKSRKNLVNTFKAFFKPDTIEKLVPLGGPGGSSDPDDGFVIPTCPHALNCDKPVSYNDMVDISDNLHVATDGKCHSLYELLKVHERDKTADILTKATAKAKEINDITNKDVKANALNRLSGKFMLFFKNDQERSKYDVAIKRFSFEKHARTKLIHYVEGWTTKKKTDWKQYHIFIDEVKELGYTQEESAWLVYEYFCLPEGKKCPLPEKPKHGTGWGKHEQLRAYLLALFNDSIEYHRSSHPRIKNKLQSVVERFNEDIEPDSVENTVSEILKDLRKFWKACGYDGIVLNPLFRPTTLARFPSSTPSFSNVKVYLQQKFNANH